MFVPSNQHSLMSASGARTYSSEALLGGLLALPTNIRPSMDKHTSLLQIIVKYGRKNVL